MTTDPSNPPISQTTRQLSWAAAEPPQTARQSSRLEEVQYTHMFGFPCLCAAQVGTLRPSKPFYHLEPGCKILFSLKSWHLELKAARRKQASEIHVGLSQKARKARKQESAPCLCTPKESFDIDLTFMLQHYFGGCLCSLSGNPCSHSSFGLQSAKRFAHPRAAHTHQLPGRQANLG